MRKITIGLAVFVAIGSFTSCKKYLDINLSPNSLPEAQVPIELLLTNTTVNTAFTGGSDLFRYASLITQQFSGQTTGGETQTQQYEKYLLQSADVNNLFSTMYAQTLNDLEVIITRATAQGAPHYSGVAKILKAYNYQIAIDAWGDLPFSEAQKGTGNLFPKYDDDAAIYPQLITLLNEGIAEVNQATSTLSPGSNSTIYSGAFSTAKTKWIRLANTLKLRLLIHYSKSDRAGMLTQMNSLIGSGAEFFTSNADNFEMPFINESNRQNPIHQFELNRTNYLFPNTFLVSMMNGKSDPRRPFYFTQFPAGSGQYVGAKAADASSQKYSRMHTFLRGAATGGTPNTDGSYNPLPSAGGITYTGAAPIRMLTFAEYNFIRAEAAVYGATGNAQAFFEAGIRASMASAGVATPDIEAYILANGTLTGTDANKVRQIIEEKYVANYGVVMEPWTDWRRTGYPAITKVSNAVQDDIPRSLPIPQNEIDLNPNAPAQKPNLLVRVFWDTQ